MSELGMTDKEFEQHQLFISEAVRLIGQEAHLWPVNSFDLDLYHDPTVKYKEARRIGLFFESNPRPILKKFQWLSEEEELPYVAYIVPLDYEDKEFRVQENMFLQVESTRVLESERNFLISNVRGVNIDPLMWICKLVPARPKYDQHPETPEIEVTYKPKTDSGYSYLNRAKK